mmetsp:Transcript_75798/g.218877  ORF Transcript_75798/g.218877 Transcript_75798/m.218877 type:complete len:232 (+) Transcript_75798:174-869(+)
MPSWHPSTAEGRGPREQGGTRPPSSCSRPWRWIAARSVSSMSAGGLLIVGAASRANNCSNSARQSTASRHSPWFASKEMMASYVFASGPSHLGHAFISSNACKARSGALLWKHALMRQFPTLASKRAAAVRRCPRTASKALFKQRRLPHIFTMMETVTWEGSTPYLGNSAIKLSASSKRPWRTQPSKMVLRTTVSAEIPRDNIVSNVANALSKSPFTQCPLMRAEKVIMFG